MDRASLRHGVLVAAAGVTAAVAFGTFATADGSVAPRGDELLRRAEESLIGRCMARHGFAYADEPTPRAVEGDAWYVVDDPWSRTHGYATMVGRPDANAAILEKLAPERQHAWQRTLNGCTPEAWRHLYGDLDRWHQARRVVDQLGTYLSNRVTADARYRAGVKAWAKCVRGRGYASTSPDDLRRRVANATEGLPIDQARAREVAATEAEVGCANSTGLPDTIRDLERTYRPQIERRFARELKTIKTLETKAIPVARLALATR